MAKAKVKRKFTYSPKFRKIPDNEFLSGFNQITDAINDAIAEMVGASVEGAQAAASKIVAEAAELAPLGETGKLRDSGTVKDPVERDGNIIIEFGFSEPYAAVQHEHTEFAHPNGGEAKFLEKAIIRNQQRMIHLIAGEQIE